MTNENKKDSNRLKKAIARMNTSAKKLWLAFLKAIRGREKPLPKHTGVFRRIAIGVVGTVSLMLFLSFIVPSTVWGLTQIAQDSLIENVDADAEEAAAKAAEKKATKEATKAAKTINKEDKTCNGSNAVSAGVEAKSSQA